MSSSHQSLPSFARAESVRFGRILVGVALYAAVVSLPAAVAVLALLPEASGFLVVAMASLTLIMAGTWATGEDDGDDEISYDSTRELLSVIAIIYVFLAGSFSALLVASTILGYAVATLGYPTAGLLVAVGFVYFDHWTATTIDHRLSVVNTAWALINRTLHCLSVLYDIPNELTDDASNQRRNLY